MKKYGFETLSHNLFSVNLVIKIICGTLIALSIISSFQAIITISKLGDVEIPSRLSKANIYLTSVISVLLCVGGAVIVIAIPTV